MSAWVASGQAIWRKVAGCFAVSAVATIVSQVALALLALVWPPVLANVAVVTVTSVPAYAANRRFVWRTEGRASSAAGFVAMNLAGLALSTLTIGVAVAWWASGWAVNAASLAAWVVLWPASFVLNDKVLFRS
jgi:putative flippase GtrA